jgi:transcription elongation factor Elf1
MKILKEGTWKNPWSREFNCIVRECNATLLVEEKDLIAPECYDRDPRRYEFTCPVCGKKNDVPAKELPIRVKEALDAKRKVNARGSWGAYDD